MCKYGCFKGSGLQSFIVACIFTYHRIRKSFYKQIDRYICLNENQIQLLKDIGFDENKIVKKYNFVPDVDVNVDNTASTGLPEPVCLSSTEGLRRKGNPDSDADLE